MIVQLLLMEGYVMTEDIVRSSVIENVNRENITVVKCAEVPCFLRNLQAECAQNPGKGSHKLTVSLRMEKK